MGQTEFVVAHYNEDLLWLLDVQDSVTVYSKGVTGIGITPSHHAILPNIGREGHTYLHHVITNYDTLPDVIIFAQGRVFDHIAYSAYQMKAAASALCPSDLLTFPPHELECFDTWYGKHLDLYPAHYVWPLETLCEERRAIVEAPFRPAEYFERFIGNGNIPLKIAWQDGATFAVTKELIRRYPRTFYQNLAEAMFGGSMAVNDPETGHFMEKFWLALWKPEEYVCWAAEDISREERNGIGQLAKGRWKSRLSCIRDSPY